jgi:hypothetical protein
LAFGFVGTGYLQGFAQRSEALGFDEGESGPFGRLRPIRR